jgi:hypothetical protein
MNEVVADYVKTCNVCQPIKPPSLYIKLELQPFELVTTDVSMSRDNRQEQVHPY